MGSAVASALIQITDDGCAPRNTTVNKHPSETADQPASTCNFFRGTKGVVLGLPSMNFLAMTPWDRWLVGRKNCRKDAARVHWGDGQHLFLGC